jgi:hypothetical protein
MRGWLSRCISPSYDFLHVLASGVLRISTIDTLEHCTIMCLKSLKLCISKKGSCHSRVKPDISLWCHEFTAQVDDKVGVSDSLHWTPVCEWYMVWCGSKNGYQKDVFNRDWTVYSNYDKHIKLNIQDIWGTYLTI